MPKMCGSRRAILCFLTLLTVVVVLSGAEHFNLRSATAVEAVDDLSGQRIGCCVGWETDYLLSDREDITLMRYDTNADALLALGLHQIDAMGVDEMTLGKILQSTSGLEIVPEPIAYVGCVVLMSGEWRDAGIMEEFNAFLEAFKQTSEYEDYVSRAKQKDGNSFQMGEVPALENGKKLVLGYLPDGYPDCYVNLETGEPEGYGIEMVQRFAYARGYTIEYVESSETGISASMMEGKMDMACQYISNVFKEQTEMSGVAYMTDPIVESDVYLLKVKEGEKLSLGSLYDE